MSQEIDFICCFDSSPILQNDDDPTVWAVICENCGQDICFLLNRYERSSLTDAEIRNLPNNTNIVVTWRGKKYDWPKNPDSRTVRVM